MKERILKRNQHEFNSSGGFVLYWMTSARRATYNAGLQCAVAAAYKHQKPLVVFEALRSQYEHASARHHTFILQGMKDNRDAFAALGIPYVSFVESEGHSGSGLLSQLCQDACMVVTDWFPCFFIPKMIDAAAKKVECALLAVDSCGWVALNSTERSFPTAHSFRRYLHKNAHRLCANTLSKHAPDEAHAWLRKECASEPAQKISAELNEKLRHFKGVSLELPTEEIVKKTGVPSSPRAVEGCVGGAHEAQKQWRHFLEEGLSRYASERSHPDLSAASGLSPYLHYGHISTHQILNDLWEREGWSPDRMMEPPNGRRAGFWGMSEGAESFFDEVVTWRELGHIFCHYHLENYASFDSLPEWAIRTLDEHSGDEREYTYTCEEFEQAQTHDPIWNAAQRELIETGIIQNYIRMLWGKKILHWSSSPREALKTMLYLNNKYALDGRDPNSYSGIMWVLGRFDRAWGPERPIFGKIRYMTSAQTKRKLKAKQYFERWEAHGQARLL